MRNNYVYIVQCKDGTYYTGWTTDIIKRLHCHNAGKGAKYTRSRKPVHLVYLEAKVSKSEALKKEAVIKKLSRVEKQGLIDSFGATSSRMMDHRLER